MQTILFLVVLGAVATPINSTLLLDVIKSTIILMGVAILIGYAYHTANLTIKEIVSVVALATTFGLIVTILPYILVFLAKSHMLGL